MLFQYPYYRILNVNNNLYEKVAGEVFSYVRYLEECNKVKYLSYRRFQVEACTL